MDRLMITALLAASVLPAQTLWEGTRYGMPAAGLRALFGSRLTPDADRPPAGQTDYSAYRVAGVPACGQTYTAFLYFAEGEDALVGVGLKASGLAAEQAPQHVQCMLKQFGQGRRIHDRKDASGQGAVFQQGDRYVIVQMDASRNSVAVYFEPGR